MKQWHLSPDSRSLYWWTTLFGTFSWVKPPAWMRFRCMCTSPSPPGSHSWLFGWVLTADVQHHHREQNVSHSKNTALNKPLGLDTHSLPVLQSFSSSSANSFPLHPLTRERVTGSAESLKIRIFLIKNVERLSLVLFRVSINITENKIQGFGGYCSPFRLRVPSMNLWSQTDSWSASSASKTSSGQGASTCLVL